MIFNRLIWKLRMWWYELEFRIIKYHDDKNNGPQRRAEERQRRASILNKQYMTPVEDKDAVMFDVDADVKDRMTWFSSPEKWLIYLRFPSGTWDKKKSFRENYRDNYEGSLSSLDLVRKNQEKYKELIKKHNANL